MKIQFDSAQPYQLDAIQAVVDVFDGQPLAQGQFEINMQAGSQLLSELGRGNAWGLDNDSTCSPMLPRYRRVTKIIATPALLKPRLCAFGQRQPVLHLCFGIKCERETAERMCNCAHHFDRILSRPLRLCQVCDCRAQRCHTGRRENQPRPDARHFGALIRESGRGLCRVR